MKYIIVVVVAGLIFIGLISAGIDYGSNKEKVICQKNLIEIKNEEKQVLDNTNKIILKHKKHIIINNNLDRDVLIRRLQE